MKLPLTYSALPPKSSTPSFGVVGGQLSIANTNDMNYRKPNLVLFLPNDVPPAYTAPLYDEKFLSLLIPVN